MSHVISQKFANNHDLFCYVCGELTLKSQKQALTALSKKVYILYFRCKVRHWNKCWALHVRSSSCDR